MKNQITYSKTVENLRKLLKDYIIKANLKSLVIGVSGGIDSGLVCALAKPVVDELGIPLIGRSISIETNKPDEEERARNIGNLFCTDFKEVDLTSQYLVMKSLDDMEGESEHDSSYKIRLGNIKARMRMIHLYNIASKTGGLVLSTDNLTEYLIGFWTLHGDVGDYGLIQQLWKTEVYGMTEWLSLNSSTIAEKNALTSLVECNATDGLGISSTDLDQILPDWKERHKSTRTGYAEVDTILSDYLELVDKIRPNSEDLLKTNHTELMKTVEKVMSLKDHPVIKRHMKSQFKRDNPYNESRDNYIEY